MVKANDYLLRNQDIYKKYHVKFWILADLLVLSTYLNNYSSCRMEEF